MEDDRQYTLYHVFLFQFYLASLNFECFLWAVCTSSFLVFRFPPGQSLFQDVVVSAASMVNASMYTASMYTGKCLMQNYYYLGSLFP